MTEPAQRRNPLPAILMVALLAGGGWFFLRHYQISGLDGISVRQKSSSTSADPIELNQYDLVSLRSNDLAIDQLTSGPATDNPFLLSRSNELKATADSPATPSPSAVRNLRIASWTIDGFDMNKLSSEVAGPNIVRTLRQFDLVAIQQVAARPRDLVPRLVAALNEDDVHYDYVVGEPTGPKDDSQRLAIVFDTSRVLVDRSQTYTVADPANQMKFDPLVAWFRAAEPSARTAWTFSLVNVSVDLARAPQEVALLPSLLSSVRFDGRGEDDVVLVGQFQADDAYLLPTIGGADIQAAVHDLPTDLFGKFQTDNLLVDTSVTSEFVGRGGTFDFLRVFNLSAEDAALVSSHLPVYAEFNATEDGGL